MVEIKSIKETQTNKQTRRIKEEETAVSLRLVNYEHNERKSNEEEEVDFLKF